MNRGWNIIYFRRNYCKIKITEDKIEQKIKEKKILYGRWR